MLVRLDQVVTPLLLLVVLLLYPRITVDKWGRVTAASDKTITLPNSGGGGSSTKNWLS